MAKRRSDPVPSFGNPAGGTAQVRVPPGRRLLRHERRVGMLAAATGRNPMAMR